ATDIITGVVSDSTGRPLPDAVIEALSLETQIARTAKTNGNGRFTILFSDGGGQYRMTARSIGMSPVTQMLYRLGEEDRLVWNARLTSHPVVLEEITIRGARRPVINPDRPTPGSSDRSLTPDAVARLPLDPTDLNLLATLVPGVVALAGTDSTAAAFSVAGLGPDANAVTLDGLLFGTGLVPQEGVRNTRVITNTYDVARGQFSGGLVSVTTRGGSNVLQGSANYSLRDQNLAVDAEESAFGQGYTQHTLSGGIGGPFKHDRLFGFLSGQARLRDDQTLSLLSANNADLTRLGVAPDSVDRFLGLISAAGLSPTADNSEERSSDNYSGLLRLDYLVSDAHTFTLRGDWQSTNQDPTRIGPVALPQTGGVTQSSSGGGMATLTSRFGVAIINEGRVYFTGAHRDGNPFQPLPAGRVQVASELTDGAQGITTLSFGGNTSLPTRSRSSGIEAGDELSWLPGDGAHRIKVGGLWNRRNSSDLVSANQFGTFYYNSLEDFEADQPASFTRTLAPLRRTSSANDFALYSGDTWRLSSALQFTYGLRWEATSLGNAPAYNPVVDSVFGRRTDAFPSDRHLSPRVGFNYIVGASDRGIPSLVLRGGVGEFRSRISPGLAASAVTATGLSRSEGQIDCVGADVPVPDWAAYRQDPSTIPTSCVSGGGPGTVAARNVTVFGDGFGAPRAWRASLGVQKTLFGLMRFSVDGNYSHGVNQTGYRELNLRSTPAFTLASEGNRPVYTPVADIVPLTGAVGFTGSRADTSFGHVLDIGSDLQSEAYQVALGISGITRSGIIINGSYTWSHARDIATGVGFGSGSTSGNPNHGQWAASDFQRRHSFLLTAMLPIGRSLELTTISRLTSGAAFTPLIGSDVNGDGYRNDRAFVFGAGAPAAVTAGMQNLLASAPGRMRSCLESQLGQVAGRNSCIGPWQASLDLQLNWRPAFWGLARKVSIQLVTANLLGGLDQLFHGNDNLHGWGQTTRPDATLLYVNSFDPGTQAFNYSVNERFGASNASSTAIRSPFQIGIQARVTIGPDRSRQALDQLRGGGPGGQGFNQQAMLDRLREAWVNPARAVLLLKDSLQLTADQQSQIAVLADSVDARQEALISALKTQLDQAGPSPDPQRLFASLQPRFQEGMTMTRDAVTRIQALLTAEQWAKVPDNVKNPVRRFGGGGRDRPQQ
ncbi:MAG: carboxypeptidase regulatory-like domain-containing protein, partial [Gemmatimonadota bacterium]